jgi:hypothetical protein
MFSVYRGRGFDAIKNNMKLNMNTNYILGHTKYMHFLMEIVYLFIIFTFTIKIASHLGFLENIDWMNSGVSNNTPGDANTQGGDPLNNGQNNNNNNNVLPHDTEEDRRRLKECMRDKLSNHHISCANTNPYDTRLDDKFTPQEHEYIAEQVVKSQRPLYMCRIEGQYPDRRYVGKISLHFIDKVFNN